MFLAVEILVSMAEQRNPGQLLACSSTKCKCQHRHGGEEIGKGVEIQGEKFLNAHVIQVSSLY